MMAKTWQTFVREYSWSRSHHLKLSFSKDNYRIMIIIELYIKLLYSSTKCLTVFIQVLVAQEIYSWLALTIFELNTVCCKFEGISLCPVHMSRFGWCGFRLLVLSRLALHLHRVNYRRILKVNYPLFFQHSSRVRPEIQRKEENIKYLLFFYFLILLQIVLKSQ